MERVFLACRKIVVSNRKSNEAMTNDYGLTFEVERARVAWFSLLIHGALTFRGSLPSEFVKAGAIIVINRLGERWELPSDEEPHDRLRQIEHDLKTLPLPSWCGRYGVPRSFVEP